MLFNASDYVSIYYISATLAFMPYFNSYFSASAIIKLLCKYRIKQAKKKHKYHLLRDISLHSNSLLFFHSKHVCPPDLKELFPSRRSWLRLKPVERKKASNSQNVAILSLYKTVITVHIKVANQEIEAPEWYKKLQYFIYQIQTRANTPEAQYIRTPVVKPIKKENTRACKICRPISLYQLQDRVIISLTAKYFTDIFDPFMHNSSYAFRSARSSLVKTHHDTIEKILAYRKDRLKEEIWVTECDLKKFFDCVNHDTIKKCFKKFEEKLNDKGEEINSNAKVIFNQYLLSYSFNHDVYKLNDTKYFDDYGISGGRFDWPKEELDKQFYNASISKEKIGVPQGGALSCLIANIILHEVDEGLHSSVEDNELLYLRFCDDMVLLHTDKDSCLNYLNEYKRKIIALKLLIHNPESIKRYDSDFWKKTKSKSPYKWASNQAAIDNIPWLGFVGYQIRYDGLIRVRKNSINKELKKQKTETNDVIKALNLRNDTHLKINEYSRKSRRQQIFALENRLIAMSVGRVTLYNYRTLPPTLCWTNGFRVLSMNQASKSQCKMLDRARTKNLHILNRKLIKLKKTVQNADPDVKKMYFGHPFSYHGFLKPKV